MLHIFFQFGYLLTPVKYYGSCFSSPKTSTIIGILVILGILGTPQPSVAGLLGLTSSNPQANATSQAQKLQPPQRTPTLTGWALGLPTSSTALIQRNEPSSPKLQPSQPTAHPPLQA